MEASRGRAMPPDAGEGSIASIGIVRNRWKKKRNRRAQPLAGSSFDLIAPVRHPMTRRITPPRSSLHSAWHARMRPRCDRINDPCARARYRAIGQNTRTTAPTHRAASSYLAIPSCGYATQPAKKPGIWHRICLYPSWECFSPASPKALQKERGHRRQDRSRTPHRPVIDTARNATGSQDMLSLAARKTETTTEPTDRPRSDQAVVATPYDPHSSKASNPTTRR